MLIAKIENGAVVDVADHLSMFPNTSFSAGGVHESFYAENGVMPVNLFKPYDHETEQLVPCPPYIEDGKVYAMCVELKPVTEPEPFSGVDSIS
jgi:hypothetical protein